MSAEYTNCAVSAMSKRQGCLSSCTPEAEFVAGSQGYLKMLAPAMDFMDQVYPHPYISFFREDNQAMMRVVETGRNPTMRYLDRVHRVNVANIHERLGNKHTKDNVEVVYTKTDSMCADIYTKCFTDKAKWEHACALINVAPPDKLIGLIRGAHDRYAEVHPDALRQETKGDISPGDGTDNARFTGSNNADRHNKIHNKKKKKPKPKARA